MCVRGRKKEKMRKNEEYYTLMETLFTGNEVIIKVSVVVVVVVVVVV